MPGGVLETHYDDEPFATGTHKRLAASAYLNDDGADFLSCGVSVGVLIKNTTDGSSGTVTAVSENTVTGTLSGGTNDYWSVGDAYEIYITDTEDSVISSIWTDKRFGRKTDRRDLERGLRPEDIDIDEWGDDDVFGPGQPERC